MKDNRITYRIIDVEFKTLLRRLLMSSVNLIGRIIKLIVIYTIGHQKCKMATNELRFFMHPEL